MKRSARQPKLIWHPLSLQSLSVNQFARVVNAILSGRISLLHDTLKGASAIPEPPENNPGGPA